eukprot:TRINITY_DN5099_c0_g1_i4.p1 TRINITY_DN5099_c0_g1~~TRINITY_DN5099_c0_g1_i4.p1  ORF type:complete len:629 (-),score=154.80 TRINITY_DN5099_c0_g1_i4:768-2654(-)
MRLSGRQTLSEITPSIATSAQREQLEWVRAHRYYRHEPRLDEYRLENSCCSPLIRYRIDYVWYLVKTYVNLLLRISTLTGLIVSIGAFLICYYLSLHSDLPINLLTVGIIFPVTFSIQNTFSRRERVLLDVADMKTSAIAIYMLARDWMPKERYDLVNNMKTALNEMLLQMALYIAHKDEGEHIYAIYEQFDKILSITEEMRVQRDWLNSVISRIYQYLKYIMTDFERIRVVSDFRTPSTFRAFTWFWTVLFGIFFSPYFALMSENYGFWAGFYASLMSSLMLVTLTNITHDIEDPFDSRGPDDLNVEMIMEPALLMNKRLVVKKKKQSAKEKLLSFISNSPYPVPNFSEFSFNDAPNWKLSTTRDKFDVTSMKDAVTNEMNKTSKSYNDGALSKLVEMLALIKDELDDEDDGNQDTNNLTNNDTNDTNDNDTNNTNNTLEDQDKCDDDDDDNESDRDEEKQNDQDDDDDDDDDDENNNQNDSLNTIHNDEGKDEDIQIFTPQDPHQEEIKNRIEDDDDGDEDSVTPMQNQGKKFIGLVDANDDRKRFKFSKRYKTDNDDNTINTGGDNNNNNSNTLSSSRIMFLGNKELRKTKKQKRKDEMEQSDEHVVTDDDNREGIVEGEGLSLQ